MKSISSKYIIAFITLFIMCMLSLCLGSVLIPLEDIFSSFQNNPTLQLRLYRTLTAFFAGSGIAVSGLLLQTIFKNPLAGPSVLGVSSGATLGIIIGMSAVSFGISENISSSLMAVMGAIGVVLVLLFASKYIKKSNTLLIIGLMMGYFVSSIVNVFSFYTDKSSLQSFVFWGLGSFSKELNAQLITVYVLIILVLFLLTFFLIKKLDLLLLGDRYAYSMGVKVKKTRFIIIIIVGLLIGVITAWCGPIAFLGIAVPHLARNFLNTSKHLHVLMFTFLFGAILALFCDVISRLPGFDQTLPLNAITSFIGAPIVVWIIFKRKMI